MKSGKSGASLLRLPSERSDEVFRSGFWQWVDLLVNGNYQAAVEALTWGDQSAMTAEELQEQIATYFGDDQVVVPVIPNERLVAMIDEKMKIEWDEEDGWAMALIPVTNEPERAKDDDVPLMGIATSFFIPLRGEHQVLEFEQFHL